MCLSPSENDFRAFCCGPQALKSAHLVDRASLRLGVTVALSDAHLHRRRLHGRREEAARHRRVDLAVDHDKRRLVHRRAAPVPATQTPPSKLLPSAQRQARELRAEFFFLNTQRITRNDFSAPTRKTISPLTYTHTHASVVTNEDPPPSPPSSPCTNRSPCILLTMARRMGPI